MRAILMGAGSLGTIVGALVSKNGGDLTLVDANQPHVDALNRQGATVTGKMLLDNIPVKAITPDQMEGLYDVVILMIKQTYNNTALRQLLPHLKKDSVVCTLQNGVPEECIGELVGRERTIGGTVGWGATWICPGTSALTSDPDRMIFEIGETDGSITPRLGLVKSILDLADTCNIITNLIGVRWSKLLMNSTMSGLSAALGCTYGDILDNDRAMECAACLTNELIDVANARGIHLEVLFPGFDFYDLVFQSREEMLRTIAWLRKFYVPDRPLKASMLQDMEKGIRCEIQQINGVVSSWGKKTGVPTLMNDTIVQIVTEFEAGKIPFPDISLLNRFPRPTFRGCRI